MILTIAVAATTPTNAGSELALCKPKLAHKVGGEISSISADQVSRRGTMITIGGQFRVLTGMGDPAPGMVSTYHLRRQDYQFTCSVRGGRVRSLSVHEQP